MDITVATIIARMDRIAAMHPRPDGYRNTKGYQKELYNLESVCRKLVRPAYRALAQVEYTNRATAAIRVCEELVGRIIE